MELIKKFSILLLLSCYGVAQASEENIQENPTDTAIVTKTKDDYIKEISLLSQTIEQKEALLPIHIDNAQKQQIKTCNKNAEHAIDEAFFAWKQQRNKDPKSVDTLNAKKATRKCKKIF